MFTGEVFWGDPESGLSPGPIAGHALESFLEADPADDTIPPIPKGVADLLKSCFQENPDDRPVDFKQIADELKEIYLHQVEQEYPIENPIAPIELSDVLNNKALSFLELGMESKAEELWREALKLDPHHLESTYNSGLRGWREGSMTDDVLVNRLEEIKKSPKTDSRVHELLGMVQLERLNPVGAVVSFKNALAESPKNGLILNALTICKELNEKITIQPRVFEDLGEPVSSVCLSIDGSLALSGTYDGIVRLWDVTSGHCLSVFQGHSHSVQALCISRDKRRALSGSRDATIRIWDIASGECEGTLEGHKDAVSSVCLSEDGRWALSGSYDRTVRLWEVSSRQCTKTIAAHEGWVKCIALSSDGRVAISGGDDNVIRFWNLATGTCFHSETCLGWVSAASISPDANYALTGNFGKTLLMWNVSRGTLERSFIGHQSPIDDAALSSDARWAISLSGGMIRVWGGIKWTLFAKFRPSRVTFYFLQRKHDQNSSRK